MPRWIILLCTGLHALQLLFLGVISEGHCPEVDGSRNILKLSFDRRLNESDGQRMTVLSARRTYSFNSTADLKLEATHNITKCNAAHGKREVHVEITVKDVDLKESKPQKSKDDALHFHHRHNRNVVLFNGGLSAQRIDLENPFYSAVFTNRPLKNNEIFQVRLDKRYADKSHCHGIGVMAHSPDEVKFYDSMYASEGTWIYQHKGVLGASRVIVPNYGAEVCHTKVGETIGVMKRGNGSLHFFMNGVDQGPAITNSPSILYGIYEVRGSAAISTIVSGE